MSGSLRAWRPMLRFARRDARRHLARTILASLLVAVPIAGLVGFVGFSNSDAPSSERALAAIPDGVQATLTATALPRGGSPFPQLPEGAPGPWMDDPETVAASAEELAAHLPAGSRLLEHWLSPDLIVSTELGLAPGEQRAATDGADRLSAIDLARLATGRLEEAVPEALPLVLPPLAEGALPVADDEVVVSSALAERLGLTLGDDVGFLAAPDTGWRSSEGNTAAAMQDSQRGYRVSGIVDEGRLRAWAPAGWLSRLVAENPGGIQGHWLVVGDAPVTWDQAKALNPLQAFAVSRHVLTHYPSADELYPVAVDVDAVVEAAVGIAIAGMLGAFLVFFLVTPAFAVSGEQLRRSLGLASAAGAAPRDLRRAVLAQGLVIGTVGGIAGAVLGFAAAVGLTAWVEAATPSESGMTERYSVSGLLAHFPWWVLPVGVLLALDLGTVAALPPARTAARLAPVDALRDRRAPRRARGRAGHLIAALGGPVLILLGVAAGALGLLLPAPDSEPGAAPSSPGTPPQGAGLQQLLTVAAILLAAVGAVLAVRAAVAWLGGRGRQSPPAIRLALRDAADHPSRTVPAALGVIFALAAASFTTVQTASMLQDSRDRGSVTVNGTIALGAQVPVSADFDRLLLEGTVAAVAEEFPKIVGSEPVGSTGYGSSFSLAPLMPAGVSCPPRQAVHLSSALSLGAPLRCTAEGSAAAFTGGLSFPSWLGSNTLLLSGDAMRATRLPGAEEAAAVLDRGGAVVGNAALLDADGDGGYRIRLAVGHEFLPTEADAERVVTVPGAFVRGLGGPLIVAPEKAEALGVDAVDYLGEVLVASSPLSWREALDLRAFVEERSPLPFVGLPDDPDPLGGVYYWAPILLLALVAVLATAVAVLLSATQGRRDAATMHAVGADRRLLVRLGLAKAGVILAVGVPAGVAAGLGLGAYQVAWSRRLEASGAWLSTVPVWGAQLGIAAGVCAAGLLAALVLTRPPRRFERRGLD